MSLYCIEVVTLSHTMCNRSDTKCCSTFLLSMDAEGDNEVCGRIKVCHGSVFEYA